MKNFFDQADAASIISRVQHINPASTPHWGKMTAAQMLAHCNAAMEMALGKKQVKRAWFSYLVGWLAKPMFLNEKPFPKGLPTDPSLLAGDGNGVEEEKNKLIGQIQELASGGPGVVTTAAHSFFGKLTAEQWARGMYKHLDHHLQQFGV